MYNRKGLTIPVLGTLLIVIAVVVASFGGFFGSAFEMENVQKGGQALSAQNQAEFWAKAFDQSVEIISKKTAYDMGMTGGLDSEEIPLWYINYPSIYTIESRLEEKILENLPTGKIEYSKTVNLLSGTLDILNYKEQDCQTLKGSKCFFVEGTNSFSVNDKTISAEIYLDHRKFNSKIDSSYFRITEAGRAIMEEEDYNTRFDAPYLIRNKFNADSRFSGLEIKVEEKEGIVYFTITDKSCLLSQGYCLVPLKADEGTREIEGNDISYDYLTLKFKVDPNNLYSPIDLLLKYTFSVEGEGEFCITNSMGITECTSDSMTMYFSEGEKVTMETRNGEFIKYIASWGGTSVDLKNSYETQNFDAMFDGTSIKAYFEETSYSTDYDWDAQGCVASCKLQFGSSYTGECIQTSLPYQPPADNYPKLSADFDIDINPNNEITKNKLSLGIALEWGDGYDWIQSSSFRELAEDANIEMVRFFEHRLHKVCDVWDVARKDCVSWDWDEIDSLVQKTYDIGAEPLIVLGFYSFVDSNNKISSVPSNMPIDSATGDLPYHLGLVEEEHWAAYTAKWVEHFKSKGYPWNQVKYYEIINEPYHYFAANGDWPGDPQKIENLVNLYNAAAKSMKSVNPNVRLGNDASIMKGLLDEFISNGEDLDFISYHGYATGSYSDSDSKIFNLAETKYIGEDSVNYGVTKSRQLYKQKRGLELEVLKTEDNLNYAFGSGTDPRIQKMAGAVYNALSIKSMVENDISYRVYFNYGSSKNSREKESTGGFGFGMVNTDDKKPWYPYFVHKMVGPNIDVGDSVVESSSTSNEIRTLSWINNGKLNILLIHKGTGTKTVAIDGVSGQFSYQKIDDPTGTSYLNPSVETGSMNTGEAIKLEGYTVMLLTQSSKTTQTSGTNQNSPLIGFSSYPRELDGDYSKDIIDDIIDEMDKNGLGIYRMSIWYTIDDTTRNTMVRHYLENCDYDLIVTRHMFPIDYMPAGQWDAAKTWSLSLAEEFKDYEERLWIEPVNERLDSDLGTQVQKIVTALRDAEHENPVVFNRISKGSTVQSWDSMKIIDELGKTYVGEHYYFTDGSWNSAESRMQQALDKGYKIFNTEIGADENEAKDFDKEEVDRVEEFLNWCIKKNIGNAVWQRYGLQNWDTYTNDIFDFKFPTVATSKEIYTTQNIFTGLSGYGHYGYTLSKWETKTINDTLKENNLNTYRLSTDVSYIDYVPSSPHRYWPDDVNNLLVNPENFVIVDRNHLYPAQLAKSTTAREKWYFIKENIFDVLETWPNNQRVAVELISRYTFDDFYTLMQDFVYEIRDKGYTNPIVITKYNQPWTVIDDPLDNTYQGTIYYFDKWTVSEAKSDMQEALDKGIKIINTEVGASESQEYYTSPEGFSESQVNDLNEFIYWSSSKGISNLIWTGEVVEKMDNYINLGLEIPTGAIESCSGKTINNVCSSGTCCCSVSETEEQKSCNDICIENGFINGECVSEQLSDDFLYGVCSHPWTLTNQDFVEMEKLGVKYLRMDFSWSYFEPTRDTTFKFTQYDNFVKLAKEHNIEIVAMPIFIPSWLQVSGGDSTTIPASGPAFNDFVKQYGEFVYALVSHYEGSINYFEIWNEPNTLASWNDDEGTIVSPFYISGKAAEKYVTLLKEAYTKAKLANPNCKIISGGIANDVNYLQKMYDSGVKGYFDYFGSHPYFNHGPTKNYDPDNMNTRDPSFGYFPKIELMRNVMVANGDGNKEIFITELGIGDSEGPEGPTTEEMRADRLERVFEKIESDPGYSFIKGLIWYQLRDPVTESGVYSLLNPDYTPKPIWYSYKNILSNHISTTSHLVNSGTLSDKLILGIDLTEGTIRNGQGDGVSLSNWESAFKSMGINTLRFMWGSQDPFDIDMTKHSNWAQNLDALLDELDSNGFKMIMYTLGDASIGGNGMYGINDPLYGKTPMPLEDAKKYIDKLAGNNNLNHNFITDSRIAMWSIGNEANIGDWTSSGFVLNSNGQWMIEISDYIRSKGGKTSFPNPYCNNDQIGGWKNNWDPRLVYEVIDPHVDYMDWHPYGTYALVNSFVTKKVTGGQSQYNWIGWRDLMEKEFEKILEAKGSKDYDHIFLSEFGIQHGTSDEMLPYDWTFTEEDRENYFKYWFEALDAAAPQINNLVVHSARPSTNNFGLFDSSGNYLSGAQKVANYYNDISEEYETKGTTSTCSGELFENVVGSSSCSSQDCCCSGTYTPPTEPLDTETTSTAQYQVTVNQNNIVDNNRMSIGFNLQSTAEMDQWLNRVSHEQLTSDADFKMIRLYTYNLDPLRSDGTYNWGQVDALVQKMINNGIEPIIVLGYYDSGGYHDPVHLPKNYTTGSSTTALPTISSFTNYCREWVRHFNSRGWDIKYYELMNEAWFYFDNNYVFDSTKAGHFLEIYNAAYDAMHDENPDVIIGNDASLRKNFLNYWKNNGGKLDMLTNHKYDVDNMDFSDSNGLVRAERRNFDPNYESLMLTSKEARQIWGSDLPSIFTEMNWAAFSAYGTDPRIQKIIGATHTALVLRQAILEDVDSILYYNWASSKNWEVTKAGSQSTGGFGFAQVNSDDNQPWFPYYVLKWIGSNIDVGDSVIESSSTSNEIRTLSWINNGNLNILLIHKAADTKTVSVQGIKGVFSYEKIDDPYDIKYVRPWENIQSGTVGPGDTIILNGYTVMLLQQTAQGGGALPFYVGLSSIPRQQGPTSPYAISSIDEVVTVTQTENLNVWRMSFPPSFNDWKTYIQYFLDNSDADLIVDYYHLDPGYMTDSQWSASTARGIEIASYFDDYQDSIWLEPCNEQKNVDIDDKAQDFVDAIRDAGYENSIVVNIFWQPEHLPLMNSVNDPLDKFWTGQHIYFYEAGDEVWTLNSAKSWMQAGLDDGLKIFNTELGADANGQNYFTEEGVNRVNEFMDWCAERGIGNAVWTMYGDYDYPKYKELGLKFPTINSQEEYSGENLATIPDGFADLMRQPPWSYIELDNNVFKTKTPSIKLKPDFSGRETREVNAYMIENLKPGDHIYWGVWVKTEDFDNTAFTGGRIGIDFYGNWEGGSSSRIIVDSQPHDYVSSNGIWYSKDQNYDGAPSMGLIPVSQFQVPFGSDWTWVYWDIVIPNHQYTKGMGVVPGTGLPAGWIDITPTYITAAIPWLDARGVKDNADVWFSDPVLYVNPSYQEEYEMWTSNSYWHTKIPSNAPSHPNSAQMVNWLINKDGHNNGHPVVNYNLWTSPVYEVFDNTPTVSVYDYVHKKYYNVPIPAGATPDSSDDHQLVVIDWYNKKTWDFWNIEYTNGQWRAGAAYEWSLDSDGISPDRTWTVGGASIVLTAGIIRDEEIERGYIDHPLICALHTPKRCSKVYPPAATTDGQTWDTWAIPEGARIQLDPSINLDSLGLSRTQKIIAKAMQEYGIVVKESGGSWSIYAEHSNTADWSNMGMTGAMLWSLPAQWRVVDYSVFGSSENCFDTWNDGCC